MISDSKILNNETLREKLIKRWFRLYFFSFLTAPARYLTKLFISNSLSVADVWILFSIISFIKILNIYNDLWLTESLQYFLPRFLIKRQYNYAKTSIYLSLAVQIFTAIIIATILRFWAPRLSIHYFHWENAIITLKYFCFYFLLINLFQTFQSIFIAIQDTFSCKLIEFIKQWSITLLTIAFFIIWNANIELYSLIMILWLLIGIIIASTIFKKKYSKELLQWKFEYYKPMVKEYIKYALRCFVWLEVSSIFWNIIQQFIIIFLWAEAAGYYSNFTSLYSIITTIIWPIIALVFPMTSEIITKKDTWKLKNIYSIFYTYLTVSILIICCLIIPLWKEIGYTLFGTKFAFSGTLLSYWAIFSLFTIFSAFNFWILAGMWKIKQRIKFMWISLITSIITLISIKWIWIYWWVLALWTWYITLRLLSFIELYKNQKFSVNRWLIINNWLLCIIIWFFLRKAKDLIFISNDSERYYNLIKLIIIALSIWWLFILINNKQIIKLKKFLVNNSTKSFNHKNI